MFALKFDALARDMRAKGLSLKKIDTVFESTPQFDALWDVYQGIEDPLYQMCTEDDGKTHTFYRIHLPTPDTSPRATVPPGKINRTPAVRNTNHA